MRSRYLYQACLWLLAVWLFLILDFAKRIDDLLFGLTWAELAVNFGVVGIFAGVLCLLGALFSLGLESLSGLRTTHGVFVFAVITINLWSLKVGAAPWLESIRPGPRQVMAWSSLVLSLALSTWLGAKAKNPYPFAKHSAGIVVGTTGIALLLLMGTFLTPPPRPSAEGAKPNVVLVTIDTVSAKRTSIYGYDRQTTPNLQKLADESVVFERFHSNFNVTGLALPSFNGYLSTETPDVTLAEALKENGYPHRGFFSFWAPELFFIEGMGDFELTRGAMTGSTYRLLNKVLPQHQLTWWAGLATEEFEYFNPYSHHYHDDIFRKTEHYPPQVSLDQGLDYLNAHKEGGNFVWIHLWPPHFPYVPDPDTEGMFGPVTRAQEPFINSAYDVELDSYVEGLGNLYDQNLYSVDRQFGKFLNRFKELGFFENSILIVSADHGESFERGYLGHAGWPVMEAITHVPLIIHRPEEKKQSTRVETLAQQLDVAPTILDLLNLPIPQSMKGESLKPYIENPKLMSERYKISISVMAHSGAGGQIAVYWKNYKLMFLSNDNSVFRLYDLVRDPEAVTDIASDHPDIVKDLFQHVGVK